MPPENTHKRGRPARTAARMILRPGRFVLLALFLLAVTSCVRARTLGLQPPGPARYAAFTEKSILIPASSEGAHVEGYVVRPDAPGPFSCAVLLHGKGGWWRAYIRYARELAGQGIASLIVDYYSAHYVDMEGLNVPYLPRKQQFELQNKDITRAATTFAKEPFCRGGKVGLIGFSLGADKAMRAAAERPEVKAVIGYYGPYDYIEFIRHRVNPILLAMAPENALKWKDYLEKNSPLFLADKVRANVLLFHGAEDSIIPVRQSLRMIQALNNNGLSNAKMKLYEGVGHNFVLRHRTGPERADSLRMVIRFLNQHLSAPAGS